MNNDLVPSLIDLYLIITHLTSKNPSQIEESIRAISLYLSHNRKDAEEVISRLSQFINSNIKSLTIPIIVKLITSILKTLADTNNVQISHIAKNLFPLLISIIMSSKWTINEYDALTALVGLITYESGGHIGQVVESHIDSIFQKCKSERMEFPLTKYAMVSLLKEFVINAPVVCYNKLIETFDDFFYVVGYYSSSEECVRKNIAMLVMDFLRLLNNRDYKNDKGKQFKI